MEEYVRQRITQLRLQKGVSEYQMSYDLGHSKSYINNITSKKALPSMTEFFAICAYFKITPIQFFDKGQENPILSKEVKEELSKLDNSDMNLILSILNRLNKNLK